MGSYRCLETERVNLVYELNERGEKQRIRKAETNRYILGMKAESYILRSLHRPNPQICAKTARDRRDLGELGYQNNRTNYEIGRLLAQWSLQCLYNSGWYSCSEIGLGF